METEIQRRQNEKNTSITSRKQEITAILRGDGSGTPNFVSITEHLSGHAQFTCSAQGSPCPQDDGSSSKLGGLVLTSHLASWALSLPSFCLEDGIIEVINDFYLIYVSDTFTAGGDFIYLFIYCPCGTAPPARKCSLNPTKKIPG